MGFGQRDLRQRKLGLGQLVRGMIDPEAPYVLPDGAAERSAVTPQLWRASRCASSAFAPGSGVAESANRPLLTARTS